MARFSLRRRQHGPVGDPEGERFLSPMPAADAVGTLGVGAVSHVDERGRIHPHDRSWSLSIVISTGESWFGVDGPVRRTRIGGLPVIECRLRVGEHDVVWRVAADEDGPSGRTIVEIETEGADALTLGLAVTPERLEGVGSIERARVAGERIVIDGRPAVELGRLPGDVVTGSLEDGGLGALLGEVVSGHADPTRIVESGGRDAGLVALLPMIPSTTRTIRVVDGSEPERSVAPAIERIRDGWSRHLDGLATVSVPAWPAHLWPAATSGVLLAAATSGLGRPGSTLAASAAIGADEATVQAVADQALESWLHGALDPRGAGELAVALSVCARLGVDPPTTQHDLAAQLVVASLHVIPAGLRPDAHALLGRIAGARAMSDAAASAVTNDPRDGRRLGFGEGESNVPEADDAFERAMGRIMSAGPNARLQNPDPIVDVRAAAGSTWSWASNSAPDDPDRRARVVLGLRRMVVDDSTSIDCAPGAFDTWLGRSVDVTALPVRGGRLSFSIRWHGERPAVLWEFDGGGTPVFTCRALDPNWSSGEQSGEALLAAPSWATTSR